MQIKKWYYHLKHKTLPTIGAHIGSFFLHLLFKTCKVHIEGIDPFKSRAKESPCILLLWHNRLAITPELLFSCAREFDYAALISQSRDGELLSTIVESYSIGHSIRVPHNDRLKALNMVIDTLRNKNQIVVITPDGPRGPRYKVKAGALHAAKATNAYIIPFSWSASRYWELNSWDKMQFPKPFSTITATFGTPYRLEENGNLPSKEEIALVEQSLM